MCVCVKRFRGDQFLADPPVAAWRPPSWMPPEAEHGPESWVTRPCGTPHDPPPGQNSFNLGTGALNSRAPPRLFSIRKFIFAVGFLYTIFSVDLGKNKDSPPALLQQRWPGGFGSARALPGAIAVRPPGRPAACPARLVQARSIDNESARQLERANDRRRFIS